MGYLLVGAFASIRQQFKISVGHFEGVQEATSDIASDAYMLESFRYLVTCGLNQGGTPAVMTAMAKYYATETMRKVINHGMDVVGGRAIQLGPRNFLALTYQSIPVAITVEGANILTRSLMIFGQGSMRCHPYLFEELQLLQSENKAAALKQFSPLLFKHLAYTFNRGAKAVAFAITGGSREGSKQADDFSKPYYAVINRMSADFALTADMALGILAGDLKRKEMLSGRLADIHSHLFIATAILKYYENGQRTASDQKHAELALNKALFNAQEAFFGFYDNFPMKIAAKLVKLVCFPFGRPIAKPSDQLKQDVAQLLLQETPFRAELKKHVYYNTDESDVMGRMESTFQMLLAIQPLWNKFKKEESKDQFKGLSFEEHIADAVAVGFINTTEAEQLLKYNAKRYDSMLTDVFDEHLEKDLPLENPHLKT